MKGENDTIIRIKNDNDSALLASAILLALGNAAFCYVEELFSKDGHACISRSVSV